MLACRKAWWRTESQQKPQPLKNKPKKQQKQMNKQTTQINKQKKATQVWAI